MHYKEIQTYDLLSFAQELQKHINEGYTVSELPEHQTVIIGNLLVTTLKAPEATEEVAEGDTPVKPKRSKKEA